MATIHRPPTIVQQTLAGLVNREGGLLFKIHNLENAQTRGLTLFWAYRLEAMIEFIESTRP